MRPNIFMWLNFVDAMGLMEIYEDCCWCGLTMDYWRPVP